MANSYTPNVSQYGFSGGALEYNIERYTGIANSVQNFIGSPMQTNENPFYAMQQKVDNAMAIAMVVCGDYNKSVALDAYRREEAAMMERGHSADSDYMRSIGLHQDCKNDFTFTCSAQNASGTAPMTANRNMFTNAQFNELKVTGSVNVGGTVYSANTAMLEQISQNKAFANNRIDHVLGAVTRSEKLSAGRSIYDATLAHLNQNDLTKHIFDMRNQGAKAVGHEMEATRRRLRNDISSLSAKAGISLDINETMTDAQKNMLERRIRSSKSLSVSEQNKLVESMRANEELIHAQEICAANGEINHNDRDLRHGRQLIARSVLGQEFYQSAKLVSKGVKVTYKAATYAVRGAAGLTYKAGSGAMIATKGAMNVTDKATALFDKTTKALCNKTTHLAGKSTNLNGVIAPWTGMIRNAADAGRSNLKSAQARDKNLHHMTRKERKDYLKTERINRRETSLRRRSERLDRNASHARARGDYSGGARLDRRRTRLDRKRERIANRLSLFKEGRTFGQRFKRVTGNVFRVVSAPIRVPFKIIMRPMQFVLDLYQRAKNWLIKQIAMPVIMAIVKFELAMGTLVLLMYLFLSFASWDPIGALITNLQEKNYVQLIVNYTTNNLCESFLEVAKVDATRHFLDNMDGNTALKSQSAESDKVDKDFKNGNITEDWFIMPEYGQLGSIWVWEEADNTTKWPEDGNGKTTNDLIYTSDLIPSNDYTGYVPVASRQTLSGPAENIIPITNMMQHRYLTEINFDNWETALGYSYYMFVQSHDIACHDTALEDTVINNVHYTEPGYSFIYAEACPLLYNTAPSWNGTSVTGREGSNEVCTNIYVHGHKTSLSRNVFAAKAAATELFSRNEDFFKETIMQIYEDHPVISGRWAANLVNHVVPWDTSIIGEGYYILDNTCDNSPSQISATGSLSGGVLDTGSDGKCTNFTIAQYGADYLKCDIVPHGEGCYDEEGHLTCTDSKHDDSHVHEFKETDDSCYVRVAVCQGHCGGHMIPQVNIVQKMTYEGLMMDDWFKTTYFLTKEEILGQDITAPDFLWDNIILHFGLNSIENWKGYWNARCATWYYPFPRSYWGLTKTLTTKVLEFLAWINDEEGTSQATDGKDIYLFAGWWEDTNKLNRDSLDSLITTYGTFYKLSNEPKGDEKYKQSRDMWSEAVLSDMSVEFNIGCGKMLSEAEIQMYLEMFSSMGLSETQMDLLEDALRHVGAYYYSLSGAGHMNGINGNSGASDCSGFISGILTRTLGTNWNQSAAGYAGLGTAWSDPATLQPGMVLAHNNGGAGYTGHVVMYAGQIDGPDGPGYYIIDCTRTRNANGSQFRKVSENYLKRYNKALQVW